MGLIVKSSIKKYTELNMSEEFARELEKAVEDMIKKAEQRAKANNRRTLYARDL